MNMRYTFYFKTYYYNHLEEDITVQYHVLIAEDFTAAVKQLEDYYGDDLVSFNVFYEDTDILTISEEEYNRKRKEIV